MWRGSCWTHPFLVVISAVIVVKLDVLHGATLRMRNLQQPEDHEAESHSICHADRTRGHELLLKLI